MKLRSILLLTTIIFFTQCDSDPDDCDSKFPPIPETEFILINQLTGESLIGRNRIYHPDSINSINANSPFRIDENQDTVVSFFFGGVDSGDQLVFHLTEADSDTIRIEYSIRQTECFGIKEIGTFVYNDKLIKPIDGIHEVEK